MRVRGPLHPMLLTSPYSDEALEHRAKPDPLDDLIRASPPRERLLARTTAIAVAVFLVAALFSPIERPTAIRVAILEEGLASAGDGRVRLRVDAAVLGDTAREALAGLSPGVAVTLVGDAWLAHGDLLGVSGTPANGVAVDVRLSYPAEVETAPAERAVLRFPGHRRSVADALADVALATAPE